ncbi:hypothetical protein A2774_00645 [Candidatus Roizmanbacteria bacterium RIFCSPHIGHO2_01_FULL_39_12c]|uniref:Uncharacterized protein n=1 Tax=Candidatus Roizmanbacteria bacterium RIFCSPHIGHO2_01_FULL_39_12c TaxID=1802031 RepID=A0A1F7GA20_9BACT|nr:MAG: hypothetical protein A2774_00645 [Candidatus Roizmanbacteria bacterium RIFCSPHIGHO2_01_FULL_39_12c]OGK47378.1 MAG: hypothetical protein A2963_04565 [Candidatus Roizmanbacteria bacterium RIFCSPLOWO2_01_FULL_40_13]
MVNFLLKENKFTLLLSLIAVVLVAAFGILTYQSNQSYTSQAAYRENLVRGCYYKMGCPPINQGRQTVYKCQPVLVCPTPTFSPSPTIVRNFLDCNDCTKAGKSFLCLDTVVKISYCSDARSILPSATCAICIQPTPSYPTPTVKTCLPPPSCLFSEPRCLLPEPIEGWCKVTPSSPISPKASLTKIPTQQVTFYPNPQ